MSLEHHQIKAAFSQAAVRYEQHAVLQKEAMLRLIDRVAFDFTTAPEQVLDLGCGTGWGTTALLEAFPECRIIAADFAPDMVASVPAHQQVETRLTDAHCLDVHAGSIDLVFSNLMIQWCDQQTALQEIKRALKPGGTVHLTSMGEHTLHELKAAWRAADDGPHVNDFVPANELADLALRLGFEEVVADSEMITMTYAQAIDVMRDLKHIGAHNTDHKRSKGLTSPQALKTVMAAYEAHKTDQGLYPATYELVYLRAKKPQKDSGLSLRVK